MSYVVITGASSGIGAEFARQLAARRNRAVVVSGLKNIVTARFAKLMPRIVGRRAARFLQS